MLEEGTIHFLMQKPLSAPNHR